MIPITLYRDFGERYRLLRSRAEESSRSVTQQVAAIIDDVKLRGDDAVLELTQKFDGVRPTSLEIDAGALRSALENADAKFITALKNARDNIADFHRRQLTQSFIDCRSDGVVTGQRVRGLSRVGLYVPGGTAAYPSSVLMNAVPARIAGVKEIVMVTPPPKDGKPNPDILAAAALCGVDRVFMAGGAQAVAALAYGTGSIPRVDKIVGPGNIYVATAKRLLYGVVDIDMVAGPSEILIMADDTANPRYLAADMMGQAEHDRLASSTLLTTSRRVAEATVEELTKQIAAQPRAEIIKASLESFGSIVLCESEAQMLELTNLLAPEHVEVMVREPMRLLNFIDNAGSVFLGEYTPEPVGDYYAGPNHVLPTGGSARFFSPLGVDSFIKRSAFMMYPQSALMDSADDIITLAQREGLYAHANAIQVRCS